MLESVTSYTKTVFLFQYVMCLWCMLTLFTVPLKFQTSDEAVSNVPSSSPHTY